MLGGIDQEEAIMTKRMTLGMCRTVTPRAVVAAMALVLAASPFAADDAAAQEITKVKYAEVVRSVFYLPKYVAIAKGYFREQGIEVDMTTAWGGDKGTAMLLTGRVDVVLKGPETASYVENGASPLKVKMFAASTATDGLFLMSREKRTIKQFKWDMIRGKTVMGWRPGSTPGRRKPAPRTAPWRGCSARKQGLLSAPGAGRLGC